MRVWMRVRIRVRMRVRIQTDLLHEFRAGLGIFHLRYGTAVFVRLEGYPARRG